MSANKPSKDFALHRTEGSMEELDGRKVKILEAIIQNYLETGEPVGSRTISKFTDLNLSSATIRNEMSDLEEMGYILQPHTSAGRIPSDKGYRFYVDHMMMGKEQAIEEKARQVSEQAQQVQQMSEMLLEKEDKIENLLQQVAKVLAVNTEYATMVTAPSTHRNKVKFIQLSRIDANQLLAVIVVEGNVIRNHVLPVSEELTDEEVLKLNILLNTHLNGLSLEEINLGMITALKNQAGIHSDIVGGVVDAVAEAIQQDDDLEVYTSGTNNIFKYPELSDGSKASEIITAFEEKRQLTELVTDALSDENSTGIQVYIGNESPIQNMKDCSVVTATYELGDGMKGTIGIVGPKRMDYEKVIHTLKTIQGQLDSMYKKS